MCSHSIRWGKLILVILSTLYSRLCTSQESRANNFDWSSHLYDAIGHYVLACRGTTLSANGTCKKLNISNDLIREFRFVSFFFHFQNNSKLLRVTCAIASLLFVISDTMIAIDKYYAPINNSTVSKFNIPFSPILYHLQTPKNIFNFLFFLQLWIMITYYAAQFGITLSIVDLQGMKQIESSSKPLTKALKNA